MLIREVKPIGKFGKKFLKVENADDLIKKIIEKPLQKACIDCKDKNIETLMSTANRNNLVKKNKKRIDKKDVWDMINKNDKIITLAEAGKGYAWLLVNYSTLSNENKKILFDLEDEYGEEAIWFVRSTYIKNLNDIRRRFKLKPIEDEVFNEKYAKEFEKRQIPLMYNIRYPVRTVCIRMPINEFTDVGEVEEYYNKIISKLVEQ